MSEYSAVRGGQLKLKGKAGSQLKKKKSKRKRGYSLLDQEFAAGELKHGLLCIDHHVNYAKRYL